MVSDVILIIGVVGVVILMVIDLIATIVLWRIPHTGEIRYINEQFKIWNGESWVCANEKIQTAVNYHLTEALIERLGKQLNCLSDGGHKWKFSVCGDKGVHYDCENCQSYKHVLFADLSKVEYAALVKLGVIKESK